MKKGLVKAQATTTERTAINIAQQWHWHTLVDQVYDKMRMENTGICNRSGKTYGELMPHFIVGLDEACLMADAHGDCKIIGSADRKKHEKMVADR